VGAYSRRQETLLRNQGKKKVGKGNLVTLSAGEKKIKNPRRGCPNRGGHSASNKKRNGAGNRKVNKRKRGQKASLQSKTRKKKTVNAEGGKNRPR